jgi:hypothetical protein
MTRVFSSGISKKNLTIGAVAGAVGTGAMDLLQYQRYRRGGGKESLWQWEFGEAVTNWDEASAPGHVGQKLERLITRRTPPDNWARSTTNIVHWATGIGWGIQFGALAARTSRHPKFRGLAFGPVVCLSSYVLLPLVGVYEPIWKYDKRTLTDDLVAHLVFGISASASFAALSRKTS